MLPQDPSKEDPVPDINGIVSIDNDACLDKTEYIVLF